MRVVHAGRHILPQQVKPRACRSAFVSCTAKTSAKPERKCCTLDSKAVLDPLFWFFSGNPTQPTSEPPFFGNSNLDKPVYRLAPAGHIPKHPSRLKAPEQQRPLSAPGTPQSTASRDRFHLRLWAIGRAPFPVCSQLHVSQNKRCSQCSQSPTATGDTGNSTNSPRCTEPPSPCDKRQSGTRFPGDRAPVSIRAQNMS